MNKTISANISGFIFNIEEGAYQKLLNYLEAIKGHFAGADGGDEIVSDIESRVAELFQERLSAIKQVITENDVDEVIEIMGRPEQYDNESESADEESESDQQDGAHANPRSKARRIYRDPEDRVLGGVCAGISHYLGWDPIVLRLILAFSILFAGTGLILYIILWIVIPEAKSTTEKLRMQGKKINVENISKKVSQEMDNVADNISNLADKGKRAGSKVSENTRKAAENAESAFKGIGRFIYKFIGFLLFISGFFMLLGLIVGATAINNFVFPDHMSWTMFEQNVLGASDASPLAIIGAIMFFGSIIIGLIWTGLKIMLNIKPKVRGVGLTLLGFFFVGIVLISISAVNVGQNFTYNEDVSNTEKIEVMSGDTLFVDLFDDDMFNNNYRLDDDHPFNLMKNENGLLYHGNSTRFRMFETSDQQASLRIEREAEGRSQYDAIEFAENISYDVTVVNDSIMLAPYFTTPEEDKWANQSVDVTLFVPEGVYVKLSDKLDRISWYNRERELFQQCVMQSDSTLDLEQVEYIENGNNQ